MTGAIVVSLFSKFTTFVLLIFAKIGFNCNVGSMAFTDSYWFGDTCEAFQQKKICDKMGQYFRLRTLSIVAGMWCRMEKV